MEKIRVLVADDHPIFLEGLCTLIAMKYPEIEIVAAVSNGEEAVEKERELAPDIVLLDIRMAVMNGVEAARRIRERRPEVKIIMLTTFNERDLIADSLAAGAKGYVLKETPIEELVNDIKSVYHGNVLLSERAAAQLYGDAASLDETPPLEALREALKFLTKREKEIFQLMLDNKSNQMIADELCLSERTVRNYISNIYQTVDVKDRFSFLAWAKEQGIK